MRRFAVLCASAILILSVSACGGDDSGDDKKAGAPATPTTSESVETPSGSSTESDSPTESDPVKQEFCATAGGPGFDTGGFEDIKGWAKKLDGITTPDDMSADEKEGMTLLVTMINGAKTEKALGAAGKKVSQGDQAKVSAFVSYVQTNCA